MNPVQAVFLSLIQGITEFIPVSSSGHLVLAQHFLGVDMPEDDIFFEVLVHLGTSISILLIYFPDLLELLRRCLARDPEIRVAGWSYVGCIALGSLPVAFVGLFFYDAIVGIFALPTVAALMLLVTAGVLYLSRFHSEKTAFITVRVALVVGLAQTLALMPGISRSGITIATALMIGVSRTEAGRFSFMLALPALLGAALLDFMKIDSFSSLSLTVPVSLLSLSVSAVVGYFALKILLNFVHRGKLHYFSYYCAAAGLISLALINIVGL